MHLIRSLSYNDKCRNGNRFFPTPESRGFLLGRTQRTTPLTPAGLREAKTNATILKAFHPELRNLDCILYSTFLATGMTAEAFLPEGRGPGFLEEPLLDERDMGHTFLMTEEEVAREYPLLKAEFERNEFETRYPGGTSLSDICAQMTMLLDNWPKRFSGKKILLVGDKTTALALQFALHEISVKEVVRGLGEPQQSLLMCRPDARGRLRVQQTQMLARAVER